ncbi:2OG-Fe(II) oxygenase [Sphingomonas sp. LT1P40]|uniref:2OG-Fe(II) oxygenase n=1 Tax=Alteristakelama amylovorans TaxID=3096166 RepID=UPI002FC7730F
MALNIPWLDYPDAFTSAECDAMLSLAEKDALTPATVWSGTCDHVDPAIRLAERCHWPRAGHDWIHDRLDALFSHAAARLDTTVDPVFEDIQFLRYGVGAHFQQWHSDAGTDRHEARRISASVELSDAADYRGGALEIAPIMGVPRTLPRGGARLFPSRMIHRVTPVTSGVRHALVAWTGLRGG